MSIFPPNWKPNCSPSSAPDLIPHPVRAPYLRYNPLVFILAIDTSTKAGSVALLRDTSMLSVLSDTSDEPYSSRLFRHLDLILQEQAVQIAQIDLYAVSAGPGSFTGLRVGLTAVKGWAEVFGKPIAPVSSLEAVAAQAHCEETLLAPVMDARRGQVFAGLYERTSAGLRRRGDDVVMPISEFLDLARSEAADAPVAFVTPTPQVLRPALDQSVFRSSPVEQVSAVLAPSIGRLGWERAQRGDLVDALTLDANYVRRSDAELLWKDSA